MTIIKATTKRAEGLRFNYRNARYTDLSQCYNKCSHAKKCAFADCMEMMRRYNGYGHRICSATGNFFTFAFVYRDENGIEKLVYRTHMHDYVTDFYAF